MVNREKGVVETQLQRTKSEERLRQSDKVRLARHTAAATNRLLAFAHLLGQSPLPPGGRCKGSRCTGAQGAALYDAKRWPASSTEGCVKERAWPCRAGGGC